MLIPLANNVREWQGLLWGVESLPDPPDYQAASDLLPNAGYAVLRAGTSVDPRYLALDFGPHGGWHGHYDKLGYVSYGLGKMLGTDPGTHSYGSELHDAWDRTSVAHNTVVVDEQNQEEAAGNLQRFLSLPAFGLATADAGDAYSSRAVVSRTLLQNADYWLDITRVVSVDGHTHRYDWVYHNPGVLSSPLPTSPYAGFGTANGYGYLTNVRATVTDENWRADWDLSESGGSYGSIWANKPEITASFTITDAVASNGSLSGQLDYDFDGVLDGYIDYYTDEFANVPAEVPSRATVVVYGDGSNNSLTLRVLDASGERFVKEVARLNWVGWRTVDYPVDGTWEHWSGNNDGVIDVPVSKMGLEISLRPGATRSGRLFADEIGLVFPSAGKRILEDFESQLVRLRMHVLGVSGTTAVVGDGLAMSGSPNPCAMARRETQNAVFTAIFQPYRRNPSIASIQALPVAPDAGTETALQINAPGVFTDAVLLTDDDARGERAFGQYHTDAAVAYLRRGPSGTLAVLSFADATLFSEDVRSILTSTVPITGQVNFDSGVIQVTLTEIPTAQLRLYAPTASGVSVNRIPAPSVRDGEYLIVALPPNPSQTFLPLVQRAR